MGGTSKGPVCIEEHREGCLLQPLLCAGKTKKRSQEKGKTAPSGAVKELFMFLLSSFDYGA